MIAEKMQALPPVDLGGIERFNYLTEITLPAIAEDHGWPVRLDHCFQRICLDHAFADVWYNHLRRLAARHLSGEPLRLAIACAETIARQGLPALRQYNAESLGFRGKLRRHPKETSR